MAGVTALVGLPGSGKSYTALDFAILPALRSGRHVITNIPLKESNLERAGYDSNLIHDIDLSDPDCLTKDSLIKGGVYVLDELWRIWGVEKKSKISEEHKSLIKEHRHFSDEQGRSIDIFLVTQSLSDIAPVIRDMVETTVITTKLLEAGLSGRFTRDYYRGSVKGTVGLKSAWIKSDDLQKYDLRIYDFYYSHTESDSVDGSINEARTFNSSYFSGWRFKALIALFLAVFGFTAFSVWSFLNSSVVNPAQPSPAVVSAPPASPVQAVPSALPPTSVSPPPPAVSPAVVAADNKNFLDRLLEKTMPRVVGLAFGRDKPAQGIINFFDINDGSLRESFTFSELRGFGVSIFATRYGVEITTSFATYQAPFHSGIAKGASMSISSLSKAALPLSDGK